MRERKNRFSTSIANHTAQSKKKEICAEDEKNMRGLHRHDSGCVEEYIITHLLTSLEASQTPSAFSPTFYFILFLEPLETPLCSFVCIHITTKSFIIITNGKVDRC